LNIQVVVSLNDIKLLLAMLQLAIQEQSLAFYIVIATIIYTHCKA